MIANYPFGFLDDPSSFENSTFRIAPLADYASAVEFVLAAPTASKRWYYPPSGPSPSERDFLQTRRYELPSTHVITTYDRPYDPEFGAYIVIILGFFLGRHLTTEGIGHLWPTPLRSELVNFVPTQTEILSCLSRASVFWDKRSVRGRKLMFGAVHWFLVTQSYGSQFERFTWMYTVLDNLHRITFDTYPEYQSLTSMGRVNHGGRPIALAKFFETPLPPSFSIPRGDTTNASALTNARNELVHEALWAGAPLGYAVSQDGHDLYQEMRHFCTQVILGLLEIPCEFRKTLPSRQLCGLDIAP